jgi:hypothetical protein
MIWILERPGERLQCEIRPALERDGFELIWSTADGRCHVEWSASADDLLQRRRFLEERLRLDGWIRSGRTTPPLIPLVPKIPD